MLALPVFAGTPATVTAPPPPAEQGITLGLEVLALRPYNADDDYGSTGYDAGFRGSLGYQFNDGLFVKGTYFGYKTEVDREDLKTQYADFVIGQNFKPIEKLSISPFIGARWASFQEWDKYVDFDGWGIVVGFDATRALGNDFSLYVNAKQSIVFGSTSTTKNDGDKYKNTTASISEIGAGLQYDFCLGGVAGNVRGGVEGQYWAGVSDLNNEDTSLFGFVLGANFRF